MRVEVRLFAVCKERVGQDVVQIDLEAAGATVGTLRSVLAARFPSLAALLPIVRFAVNREFAGLETPVHEADEIALIPPVSGGTGQGPFSIVDRPIAATEVEDAVRSDGAGAIVSFVGTVRDATHGMPVLALEYEAYPEMAERYLRKIGSEVAERWPEARVAILHRIGRLSVGEISVVIAVSHPHRGAAFEGCRYAIEELKKDVPIWKKEIRTDGSIWVGVGS